MSAPVLSRLFSAQGRAAREGSRPNPVHERPRGSAAAPQKGAAVVPTLTPASRERPQTPNPQSQSFSRSYGPNLPTSLTYIIPSTRGCSPWRPDAVMSTTWGANKSLQRIFTGRPQRTGPRKTCAAFPASKPYLRVIRFQGLRTVKKKRELFPG